MKFKVILLHYKTDGYRPTGQCLGKDLNETEAHILAKEYNQGKSREGMGPQASIDGGTYAVAVPDQET